MGFFSHRVRRSDLKAGDHIYTWRGAFIYSHHGIYIGKGKVKVMHFTQDCTMSSSSHFSSICYSSSCSGKGKSGVIVSCLNCFLEDGALYRFQYGVCWLSFNAKLRGGSCTTAQSDPPELVMHRCSYLIKDGFDEYDVFKHNCEDFALYCKTGLLITCRSRVRGSGQASAIASVSAATMACVSVGAVVASPIYMTTAAAITYSVSRYESDLGVGRDVIKVNVEDIAAYNDEQTGLMYFEAERLGGGTVFQWISCSAEEKRDVKNCDSTEERNVVMAEIIERKHRGGCVPRPVGTLTCVPCVGYYYV